MNYSGIEHRHQLVTMPRKMDDVILARSEPWEDDARRERNRVASDFYVTVVEAVFYSMIVVGFVYGLWRAYKTVWPWIVVKVLWIWDAGPIYAMRWVIVTVAVMFMGLVPIMWSTGAGSDVMKRIAAPMIGGIFTSFIMELLVYPAIYEVWRWRFHLRKQTRASGEVPA